MIEGKQVDILISSYKPGSTNVIALLIVWWYSINVWITAIGQTGKKLWSDKQKVNNMIMLAYLSLWGGFYSFRLVMMFDAIH